MIGKRAKKERQNVTCPGGISDPASLMNVCMARKTMTDETFSAMPLIGFLRTDSMIQALIRLCRAGRRVRLGTQQAISDRNRRNAAVGKNLHLPDGKYLFASYLSFFLKRPDFR